MNEPPTINPPPLGRPIEVTGPSRPAVNDVGVAVSAVSPTSPESALPSTVVKAPPT